MSDDRDPAVDMWTEAINKVCGPQRTPRTPDLRTPFERALDDHLEDVAEGRADYRSYDFDGNADEAADRYHERGNE
jgi:hypothetical protein